MTNTYVSRNGPTEADPSLQGPGVLGTLLEVTGTGERLSEARRKLRKQVCTRCSSDGDGRSGVQVLQEHVEFKAVQGYMRTYFILSPTKEVNKTNQSKSHHHQPQQQNQEIVARHCKSGTRRQQRGPKHEASLILIMDSRPARSTKTMS